MNKAACVLVALLLFLSPMGTYAADESEAIDFDIYRADGLMAVWVDLSPVITSKRVAEMKEGIDIALEYNLSLLRPRRFWGSHKESRVRGVLHIGYRHITQDFFLSEPISDSPADRYFLSLAELHKFLTDSVTVELAELDSLEHDKRYFIQIALTCIALTSFNVAEDDAGDESGESAVKWLFKEFLDLTNFGRQNYAVESRLFSLTELSPRR